MVLQTLKEVRETMQGAGDTVGSTVGAFSKAVGNFVCGVYHKYPDWTIGKSVDPLGFASSVRQSFLNEVCGPPPVAENPGGYSGGQCICKPYIVSIKTSYLYEGGGPYSENYVRYLDGPIAGIRVAGPSSTTVEVLCRSTDYRFQDCGDLIWRPVVGYSAGPLTNLKANITSIVTGDSSPDNCGDAPGQSSPLPGPDDLKKNVTINVKNDISPKIDLTIPFIFNDFGIDLDFPLNFKINVDLNGPNIDLHFGPDGIDFKGPKTAPPASNDPVTLPPDFVKKVDDLAKKVEDCCEEQKVEDPTKFTKYFVGVNGPKSEAGIKGLAYVEVTLVSAPSNVRSQAGGGAPDVKYVGWFEFSRGTWNFPRQPIHFNFSAFKAPVGATGYAYTMYSGYTASHAVVTHNLETPGT